MNKLFEIETDDVELSWRAPAKETRKLIDGIGDVSGHLVVRELRTGVTLSKVWRTSVPEPLAYSQSLTAGPQLYEQTDYRVYVRAKRGKRIDLVHSDPNVRKGLVSEDGAKLVFGTVNFKSEVGFSKFAVTVEGQPEFEFEVEVFPTKLDYKSDYEQLVAETQDYVSGLVFEYLRSTYKLSIPLLDKQSSTVEWLLILNLVAQDLERSCNFVAHRPVRSLIRERQSVKAEKLRRLDSTVRRSVQRGAGSGAVITASDELHLRQHLPSSKAGFTLDTPEHRWIAMQLRRIRERLLTLRSNELAREQTERRQKIITDLRSLEQRILQLQQLEPFQESTESPPAGFASLQLLSAPGYRECYRACNMLSLGLQIEGGPINLALKEISLLYEYWCFLTLVKLLSQISGQPVPVDQLVKATGNGLEIQLKKGKESIVRFRQSEDRQIEIIYNKPIGGKAVLVPQQPDIIISLKETDWPSLNLLLDAKYRVKYDDEYVSRYLGPGPDIDAVNALHRYRDAILEFSTDSTVERPKRTIIQAAAVFPFRESVTGSYRQSRLWDSLDRLGIGAIPLLPGCKQYLEEWLLSVIQHGGWSVAERAIRHRAADKADDWRVAAAESVLIGVLNPTVAEEHLDWIIDNRCYYMPLLKAHPRQLFVKHVAIYSPMSLRNPGAISHRATVVAIDVTPRSKIETPWQSSRDSDELQVVYRLTDVEPLTKPIVNRSGNGKGQRFSSPRWASRLSLERARTISELFLESEPEWRLYEELRAAEILFKLIPAAPGSLVQDESNWRTWFEIQNSGSRIRYAGVSGFKLESEHGDSRLFGSVEDVVHWITESKARSKTL